jgi:hypothetical protein
MPADLGEDSTRVHQSANQKTKEIAVHLFRGRYTSCTETGLGARCLIGVASSVKTVSQECEAISLRDIFCGILATVISPNLLKNCSLDLRSSALKPSFINRLRRTCFCIHQPATAPNRPNNAGIVRFGRGPTSLIMRRGLHFGVFAVNRRYRNFAPFVRQTGERKAQACAIEMLPTIRKSSPDSSGRSRSALLHWRPFFISIDIA